MQKNNKNCMKLFLGHTGLWHVPRVDLVVLQYWFHKKKKKNNKRRKNQTKTSLSIVTRKKYNYKQSTQTLLSKIEIHITITITKHWKLKKPKKTIEWLHCCHSYLCFNTIMFFALTHMYVWKECQFFSFSNYLI